MDSNRKLYIAFYIGMSRIKVKNLMYIISIMNGTKKIGREDTKLMAINIFTIVPLPV